MYLVSLKPNTNKNGYPKRKKIENQIQQNAQLTLTSLYDVKNSETWKVEELIGSSEEAFHNK